MMLPKKKRLTSEEFGRFFKSGRRIQGANLQLIHTPFPVFHGSAVVGKKVFKKAVKRNKTRRQIYDALYRASRNEGFSGVYILIAKPSAAVATYTTLRAEVEELLAKVTR